MQVDIFLNEVDREVERKKERDIHMVFINLENSGAIITDPFTGS